MTPEFSRTVEAETIGASPKALSIEADAGERAALAKRFGLVSIERLMADARVDRRASIIHAEGRVIAAVVQSCVVTGDPLTASVDAPFAVRFAPELEIGGEEELELSETDCDTLVIEDGRVDLGELAAETLALALDPFPRCADADAVIAEVQAKSQAEASPFAGLQALKDRLGDKNS